MKPDATKLRSDLKHDEGVRDKPYLDSVGLTSIGVGRNLSHKGLRPDEIEYLFTNDIKEAEQELDRICPWWSGLPEPAARGLCNMLYNVGAPRLLGFKKMLAALESHDWDRAAQEAEQSHWSAQVGQRAKRIADLFRESKYV